MPLLSCSAQLIRQACFVACSGIWDLGVLTLTSDQICLLAHACNSSTQPLQLVPSSAAANAAAAKHLPADSDQSTKSDPGHPQLPLVLKRMATPDAQTYGDGCCAAALEHTTDPAVLAQILTTQQEAFLDPHSYPECPKIWQIVLCSSSRMQY